MNPNDPTLRSFIPVPPESHFPIQNLPFGIFSTPGARTRRVGVAIGALVLDLAVLDRAGLLNVAPAGKNVFEQGSLNAFVALGRSAWREVRPRVSELLRGETATLRDDAALRRQALVPMSAATFHLPFEIGGYTDFYSSKEHATNVGSMFRD